MSVAAPRSMEFKRNYGNYIRCSFLIAIAVHFVIFFFSPPFEFEPYVLPDDPVITVVPPPIIVVPPPPGEVPQPVIPVPAARGEAVDANVDVPPTSPRSVRDLQPPPLLGYETPREFYAFDEFPVLTKFVYPKYPELARQAGIEGVVLLEVLVGIDGKVLEARVVQSDVTPAMEKAAVQAAWQFLFRPARQRTFPVEARMVVPVSFKLN